MLYCCNAGGGMGLRVLSYTHNLIGVFAGARPCVCMCGVCLVVTACV